MRKLVLFDIDGTLIRCGKAPRRAIMESMTRVYGSAGNIDGYSFSGRTDSQIVFDLMVAQVGNPDEVLNGLQDALSGYVQNLDQYLRPEDVTVLDGVPILLEELSGQPNVVVGLLTGNVEEGARIKLSRAGLDRFFYNGREPVGAFGSDHMDRNELPPVAVERAYRRYGKKFSKKDIVIIGDSPHDVTCGRAVGARSIAVATGWHSVQELLRYDPDFALENLSDTTKVINQINQ